MRRVSSLTWRRRYITAGLLVALCGSVFAVSAIAGTSKTGHVRALRVTTAADSCGYPIANTTAFPRGATTFSESTVLKGFSPRAGAIVGDQVIAFYSDEHALTLGGAGADWSGTQATAPPGSTGQNSFTDVGPNLGAAGAADINGRPLSPLLYITIISSTGAAGLPQSGDWQAGPNHTFTTGIAPTAIYGSYKPSPTSTFKTDPPKNVGNLGTLGTWAGLTAPLNGGTAFKDEGFTSAIVYDTSSLGLTSGNIYKLQFMVHDGDQNNTGGDTGEGCTSVIVPSVSTQGTGSTFDAAGHATISDIATVTGASGGFVTFSAYGPFPTSATVTNGQVTCTDPNPPTTTGNRVSGPTQVGVTNGSASTGNISVSAAGKYYFTADYRVTATGPIVAQSLCSSDPNELVVVNKRGPAINTDARSAATNGIWRLSNGSVTLSDVATLTGGTSDATGTITFRLFNKTDTTCSGTALGTAQVAVNAAGGGADNASYSTVGATVSPVGGFTVTSGGTYHWTAAFVSTDAKNSDASDPSSNFGSTCAADSTTNHENPLVINPSISVTKDPRSQTISSGSTVTFTIVVTNTGDSVLTGVNTTDLATAACQKTAAQIATLRENAPSAGVTSVPATAPAPGSTFQTGDSLSYTCTTDPLTAPLHNVVVACGTPQVGADVCDNSDNTLDLRTGNVGIEGLASNQDFKPKDTATNTLTMTAGATPPALTGKLGFYLYKLNPADGKADCNADHLIYSNQVATTNSTLLNVETGTAFTESSAYLSALVSTAITNGATIANGTDGSYKWRVIYSKDGFFGSGADSNKNGEVDGACGTEHFEVTNG